MSARVAPGSNDDNPIRPSFSNMEAEFVELHKGSSSYLTVASPYIRFRGLADEGSTCSHVTLKNESSKHIVFNIRSPPPNYFAATPRLGYVAPGEKIDVYFSFSGRCMRMPDDVIFIYAIYQLEVPADKLSSITDDLFTTKHIRKIWKEYGKEPVKNILYLSSLFALKGNGKCGHAHTVGKAPNLDEKGEIVEEEAYDPDLHNDSEQLPSAEE